MDTKFLSWFLSGGSVALPKRLLAYMQPLNLNFEELGELVYLFSLEGRIPHGDIYGKTAASDLVKKRFITYNVDTGAVSFDPLFDKMFNNTTAGEQAQAQGNPVKEDSIESLNKVVKRYEKEKGIILPSKARQDLSEIILRYGWDSDLSYMVYDYYYTNQRNHYSFLSFAQMAHNAGVNDTVSFKSFAGTLNYELTKVREVLRLLGKRNMPTEPQRALYAKWTHEWQFSHELIIMAIEDTTGADNPSMNYVDAILENWRRMGISRRDQVEAYRTKYKAQTSRQQKKSTGRKKTVERYVSAEGPRDFSNLEE